MNSFLSRWSANCVEPVRLLGVTKKSGSNCSSVLLKNARSAFDVINTITRRNVSTTSRLRISYVYKVTVKTGDKFGAGTDSNVFVRMIGALGSTDEFMLKTSKQELERGRIDHYNIASDDVGPLKKIIIRHDNTGFAPGWYLDWVSIRDGKGKKYNFRCDNWLVKGESYGNIKLLKEDSYVDSPVKSNNVDYGTDRELKDMVVADKFDGNINKVGINDIVGNSNTEKKDLKELPEDVLGGSCDLKDKVSDASDTLEHLNTTSISIISLISDDKSVSLVSDSQSSTRHAASLSPAVRNLLDTYDIDLFKVSPSGPHSRVLKGDVLAYIAKENITRKNFVLNMIHPVEMRQIPIDTKLTDKNTVSTMEDNYMDYIANESDQFIAQELKLGKFEIPHLYMSVSCSIDKLIAFTSVMEQDFYDFTKSIVFVRLFCRALEETFDALGDNQGFDMLVSHNGSPIILRNCNDANVQNIFLQYKHLEESVNDLVIPRYGLNILDTDGVCQLSTVLRVGQIVSLNIGGIQIGVGLDGNLTKSVNVAISCDSRVISEVTCALLLVNCKKYITNPDLIGL